MARLVLYTGVVWVVVATDTLLGGCWGARLLGSRGKTGWLLISEAVCKYATQTFNSFLSGSHTCPFVAMSSNQPERKLVRGV